MDRIDLEHWTEHDLMYRTEHSYLDGFIESGKTTEELGKEIEQEKELIKTYKSWEDIPDIY